MTQSTYLLVRLSNRATFAFPFAIFRPSRALSAKNSQMRASGAFSLLPAYVASLANERSARAKMTHIEVFCDQNLHLRGV